MFGKPKKTKRIFRRIVLLFILGLTALLAWSMLFGRLVPFVPWTFAYGKSETDKAMVYYRREASTAAFARIDALVAETETFHHLSFEKKPEIFVCESDAAYRRITGTNARFVTMPFRGRIYVSPRAESDYLEKRIQFKTYIKHELSHALLYQHMSIIHTLFYPAWFMEGMAMVSAEQVGADGYLTYEKVRETLREGYFVEPNDWGTILTSKGESVRSCPLAHKFWFIYAEFALIIRDMMTRHGQEKVLQFMKNSLSGDPFDVQFQRHFGTSIEEVFATYRRGGRTS